MPPADASRPQTQRVAVLSILCAAALDPRGRQLLASLGVPPLFADALTPGGAIEPLPEAKRQATQALAHFAADEATRGAAERPATAPASAPGGALFSGAMARRCPLRSGLATGVKVAAGRERMAALPYHEEAHVALKVMGALAAPNELPMMKRLGAATKAGMEAIAAANAASAKL